MFLISGCPGQKSLQMGVAGKIKVNMKGIKTSENPWSRNTTDKMQEGMQENVEVVCFLKKNKIK